MIADGKSLNGSEKTNFIPEIETMKGLPSTKHFEEDPKIPSQYPYII
jgi:hypothetical protein